MATTLPLSLDVARERVPELLALSTQPLSFTQLQQTASSLKESMHWLALENWLHHCQLILPKAQSLADVKGLIEASYHSRILHQWDLAYQLLCCLVGNPARPLYEQLADWGHYRIQIELWSALKGKLDGSVELVGLNELGHAHRQLGEFSLAAVCHQTQLDLAKQWNNDYEVMRAFGGLGHLDADQCQFRTAFSYFERQKDLANTCNAFSYQIDALLKMARIQATVWGHKRRGLANLESALTIARQQAATTLETRILSNLGDCYLWQGNYAQALAYQQQTVTSPGYAALKTSDKVLALDSLGLAQCHQNQVTAGIASCQQALDLAIAHDLARLELVILSDLSLIEGHFHGDVAAAIAYAQRGLQLGERLGNLYYILRTHANLAIYFAIQSETEQAEKHLQYVRNHSPGIMRDMQANEKVHILACIAQVRWLRGERLFAIGLVLYSLLLQPPWSNVNGRLVLKGAISALITQPLQKCQLWLQQQWLGKNS